MELTDTLTCPPRHDELRIGHYPAEDYEASGKALCGKRLLGVPATEDAQTCVVCEALV